MARVVDSRADDTVVEQVRREVEEMATAFPVPGVSGRAGVSA
jgi:glycine/serine hydroxymethyltransferase